MLSFAKYGQIYANCMDIGQIKVFCYSSCRTLAGQLKDKLEQGNRKVILYDIEESFKRMTPDSSMNVFIFVQEDMNALPKVLQDNFPRQNKIKKECALSVAFCINCTEIPLFLDEFFLVKEVGDSAEDIRREIVQIHNQIFYLSKERYGYFVGRNNEIEQFQSLLYSERASQICALVVSGRSGVGREAYVRECIRQEKGVANYEPYILSMGKNGNIELFLIQLNSIHHLYGEDDFMEILKSGTDRKVEVAVKLLNELFSDDNFLILYDDGAACVRYNRGVSEWFKSIVTHPMMMGGMRLYVISNISVSYSRIKTEENLAFITLYGLTVSDRKKLLYKRLSDLSMSLPEDQVTFLVDNLVYSPNQLMRVAEDLKEKGFKAVRTGISKYLMVGDKKIMSLINSYTSSEYPEAKNILVLLSRIEYVSNKILNSVFSEYRREVENAVERFMSDGIVERFGEWMDLIRLDSSISDYIRRNKIDYTEKGLSNLVITTLDELTDNTPKITEDYATYLYKLKKGVQRGLVDKELYIVPSVLVNTIAESYDDRKWEQTVLLCKNVIDAHPDFFDDVYREIYYWYCLALARMQDGDRFETIVQKMVGADYHFLKGFYLRIGKQYAKAEDEYIKALEINPSFSRAKREMVIVLQAQHKFRDAQELAELNYEKDPENAYHIHAYFRCLVRKSGITPDERNLLIQFKEDKNRLFKSEYYRAGMDFEYKRFVDRAKPEELLPMATELLKRYGNILYIKDITDDYYVSLGMKSHMTPADFSDEFYF